MPWLEISLRGPLLVAGSRASELGADLATARRFDGELKRWVPYIPATALRGAVRIQLEALLAGAGRPAVDPYPLERPGEACQAHEFKDPVARLFGCSGPAGERSGALEGALRFGDALPTDPEQALAAVGVRPGVELDDYKVTAADQKLFFREVAEVAADRPLVFRAFLDTGEAAAEEIELLRAAVEWTYAIGAGKSKGGGAVTIAWREDAAPAGARVHGDAGGARRARVLLTLREPAHFGDGGPHRNHHATRGFLPGATVRGALAWALLRADRTAADTPGFQRLFVEAPPVSFGDALPVDDPAAAAEGPVGVRPATARKKRLGGRLVDLLVGELARERVNRALAERGSPHVLRSIEATERFDPRPAYPTERVLKRTRTRVSLDRYTGTARDGRLFSIEQIEPWLLPAGGSPGSPPGSAEEAAQPARFVSWIEGLDPVAAKGLAHLAGTRVLLGAGRNHGLGWADVEVTFAGEPEADEPEARVRRLAERIAAESRRLAAAVELPPGAVDTAGVLPLVLVGGSPYVPSGGPSDDIRHPLAEPEVAALGLGPPVRSFLLAATVGGYDQRSGRHPLKDLWPAAGPGSVWVYDLATEGMGERLAPLLAALRRGVGRCVESGCGRFELFEPRNPEVSDGL